MLWTLIALPVTFIVSLISAGQLLGSKSDTDPNTRTKEGSSGTRIRRRVEPMFLSSHATMKQHREEPTGPRAEALVSRDSRLKPSAHDDIIYTSSAVIYPSSAVAKNGIGKMTPSSTPLSTTSTTTPVSTTSTTTPVSTTSKTPPVSTTSTTTPVSTTSTTTPVSTTSTTTPVSTTLPASSTRAFLPATQLSTTPRAKPIIASFESFCNTARIDGAVQVKNFAAQCNASNPVSGFTWPAASDTPFPLLVVKSEPLMTSQFSIKLVFKADGGDVSLLDNTCTRLWVKNQKLVFETSHAQSMDQLSHPIQHGWHYVVVAFAQAGKTFTKTIYIGAGGGESTSKTGSGQYCCLAVNTVNSSEARIGPQTNGNELSIASFGLYPTALSGDEVREQYPPRLRRKLILELWVSFAPESRVPSNVLTFKKAARYAIEKILKKIKSYSVRAWVLEEVSVELDDSGMFTRSGLLTYDSGAHRLSTKDRVLLVKYTLDVLASVAPVLEDTMKGSTDSFIQYTVNDIAKEVKHVVVKDIFLGTQYISQPPPTSSIPSESYATLFVVVVAGCMVLCIVSTMLFTYLKQSGDVQLMHTPSEIPSQIGSRLEHYRRGNQLETIPRFPRHDRELDIYPSATRAEREVSPSPARLTSDESCSLSDESCATSSRYKVPMGQKASGNE